MADGLSGQPRFAPEPAGPSFVSGEVPDELIWIAENQRRLSPGQISCTAGLSQSQKRYGKRVLAVLGSVGVLDPELLLFVCFVMFWVVFAALIIHRAVIVCAGATRAVEFNAPAKTRRAKKGWPTHFRPRADVQRA